MKKVIFVCLLTLSVCFSQSTEQSSQLTPKVPLATGGAQNSTDGVTSPPAAQGGAQNATATNTTGQAQTPSPKPNAAPTSTPSAAPTPTSITPPTTSSSNTVAPPHNATNGTGTTASTIPPTTESPKPTTEHTPTPSVAPVPKPDASTPKTVVQARGFDGASFVGGIILTLGLIAIGFMGLKYYRAQTERNYHTL